MSPTSYRFSRPFPESYIHYNVSRIGKLRSCIFKIQNGCLIYILLLSRVKSLRLIFPPRSPYLFEIQHGSLVYLKSKMAALLLSPKL
jgi:hypothetical protein